MNGDAISGLATEKVDRVQVIVLLIALGGNDLAVYRNRMDRLDGVGRAEKDGGRIPHNIADPYLVVKEIHGSYSNVVGFPCELFEKLLKSIKG